MEIAELPEFQRDFKRLSRKYRSLPTDFEELKEVLSRYPRGRGEKHWNKIHESDTVAVYKTRVVCASLRSDDIRIIYGYREVINHIDFIEIYFKGGRENENRQRIKDYLSKS